MYSHSFLIALILFYSFDTCLSADPHWDYGRLGPEVWVDYYPLCGGSFQSPINIKTACTTYQAFAPFQFSSGYNVSQNFTLTNNGHTISATQIDKTTNPLTITGGGLTETFTFVNFHLHWGENYKSGSEHQVNGEMFAGEIHFVHANAAQTQYAVLGFFIQSPGPSGNGTGGHGKRRRRKRAVTNPDNATTIEWDSYIEAANDLNQTNSTTVASFRLASLVGISLDNFYRYAGSLTTPPCSEIVTWTVFQKPIQFLDDQIEELRQNLFFEDYRGPQPLYNRPVYRNFQNDTLSSISDYNICAPSNRTDTGKSNGNSILFINKQFLTYSYFYFFILFFLNIV